MFFIQTLLRGTFSLLTCHLQFRPQNSPYFLRKPRTSNEWSGANGRSLLSGAGEGEGSEYDWGEVKSTSKKYDRN